MNQSRYFLSWRCFGDARSAVIAGGGNPPVIRTESQGSHQAVAIEMRDFFPRGGVENPHGVAIAARGDPPSVVTKLQVSGSCVIDKENWLRHYPEQSIQYLIALKRGLVKHRFDTQKRA